MTLDPGWKSRAVSPQAALAGLLSKQRIFIQGAAATPTTLLDALCLRRDLEAVRLYHLHTAGPCHFAAPEHEGRFRSISLFTGLPLREAVAAGRADFMPIFLSDIPGLFSSGRVPLDVALVQLSPPDAHGNCTLGTSVDAARAAVDTARFVIAEINEQMPRTHGNTAVRLGRLHAFTLTDRPIFPAEHSPPTE